MMQNHDINNAVHPEKDIRGKSPREISVNRTSSVAVNPAKDVRGNSLRENIVLRETVNPEKDIRVTKHYSE